MHSPDENHPSQTFPANQDQFPRRESSLSDIFIYPGCIPTTKIIPARLFPRIRINSPTGNHLSQPFLSNQDAFRCPKSSLQEETCKSGLLPHQNASPAASKSSRSSFPAITSFFSNRQLLINQQIFSHQAFSFPGSIRSNAQKLCDRRCNTLYAYILWLFPGLEIFSPALKFFPLTMNGMVISSGEPVPCVLSWPPWSAVNHNGKIREGDFAECGIIGASALMMKFENDISMSLSNSIPQ